MRLTYFKKIFIMLAVVSFPVLAIFSAITYGANIVSGYPGSSNSWDGLTTNTIIKIDLDQAVAMIGDMPDMDYIVKKASFNGFDFVFSDVLCDVSASDNRKSIMLYPLDIAEEYGIYAYKILNINFQGGGSAQNYTKCYATGDNPVSQLDTTMLEALMCTDDAPLWQNSHDDIGHYGYIAQYMHGGPANHCLRCHLITDDSIFWLDVPSQCILTP